MNRRLQFLSWPVKPFTDPAACRIKICKILYRVLTQSLTIYDRISIM